MKKESFKSAELVSTREGKQYHIGLKPGDVAPYILLCGEPDRARRVAKYFDKARPEITNREYVTITGIYKGTPVSVMATGIGADNTEIAIVELMQIVKNPTIIRIGSCGALKKEINIGDLVISQAAVRFENTSLSYVVEGYPAFAHHEVVIALLAAAGSKGFKSHLGTTATVSGFYGAQARSVAGFKPLDTKLLEKLENMNVANMEMESSCLFTLCSLRNARAGAVCAAYSQRHKNVFVDTKTKSLAEKRCVETGLKAIEILKRMDASKGKKANWLPRTF